MKPHSPNRMPSTHQLRQSQQQVIYKYVKPSQQIYRPPSARVGFNRTESPESHSSSTTSTSQSNNESNKVSNTSNYANITNDSQPLKSALKRSKSFGSNKDANNNQESIGQLMSIDGISWESVTLVRRAMEKTNSLTMNQLMQVIRILCNKALEKSCNSQAMANICLIINDKQCENRNHLFIESLLNCLREWFNERDKLRLTSGGARRWTAYVSFITELYINLRTGNRNARSYFDSENDGEYEGECDEYDFSSSDLRCNRTTASVVMKQTKQFSILLFDSCQAILLNSNSTPSEIECLQSVLRSCGKYLEEDNPTRMKTLVMMIRDAFLMVSSPHQINCQKLYLEMIELSSSHWNFSQSQLIYYFPYTKME